MDRPLRLQHHPPAPLELGSQGLGRDTRERLAALGLPPVEARRLGGHRLDRTGPAGFDLGLESLDELVGLVPGEAATGLALREAERATRIAQIGVTGGHHQLAELTELARRGRWTGLLTERHGASVAGPPGTAAHPLCGSRVLSNSDPGMHPR